MSKNLKIVNFSDKFEPQEQANSYIGPGRKKLAKLAKANFSVLLVGPPGIGKTARAMQAAEDCGRKLVVIRASLSERIDLGGALVPNVEKGITVELPLASLHALMQPDCPPTILLLDDLGQAPIDVQAACMRLFDAGYLSPNVLIWGATNRPQDKAGVSGLCEPLRSRFNVAFSIATPPTPQKNNRHATEANHNGSTYLSPWAEELESWLDWASNNNVPCEVIAWHRASHGRTLYDWKPSADPAQRWADYRSWAAASKFINLDIDDIHTLSGVLGPSVAMEFTAFLALKKNIPTLKEIMAKPETAEIPTEPNELWLVSTACSSALTAHTVTQINKYLARLPRMYCAMAMRDAWKRERGTLAKTPEFAAWYENNKKLMGV